jgi:hypothetical protein
VGLGFVDSATRIVFERQQRMEQRSKMLSFGIPYLDDALGGIFPRDLILAGALTGIGKTTLVADVAMNVAAVGKKVFVFALEAEENEIERRVKFPLVAKRARAIGIHGLRFMDWYKGDLDESLGDIEEQVDVELSQTLTNLFTFYRSQDFYVDHLEKMILEAQDKADLIVLDHLHYVDLDDDNENRAFKNVVKRIRDVSIRVGKPVLVVAHLRKPERKNAPLMPSLYDFHGTSDIAKIATKAIMISPAYDWPTENPTLWATYVATPKCRFDGSATRFAAILWYDATTGRYGKRYRLGRFNQTGDTFEPIGFDKLPTWAKQASQ